MSNPQLTQDIIDTLVSQLETADLPRHLTAKYRRPYLVLPEDCPLLCVYVMNKALTNVPNRAFQSVLTLGVSWQEAAVDRVKTLRANPNRYVSLLTNVAKLEAAIRQIALDDWGVFGAYQVLPTAVVYQPGSDTETGAVEGYTVVVDIGLFEVED